MPIRELDASGTPKPRDPSPNRVQYYDDPTRKNEGIEIWKAHHSSVEAFRSSAAIPPVCGPRILTPG
jgi:hypothetical protein